MPIGEKIHNLKSAKGVFSYNGIDKGTEVLVKYLQSERGNGYLEQLLEGGTTERNVLDLGCGWGLLSLVVGLWIQNNAPDNQNGERQAASITGVDVNEIAVQLTNTNAKLLNLNNTKAYTPENLPQKQYDLIISNPPIRIGKANTLKLLDKYLQNLKDSGVALLVIQKNLGADSIAGELVNNFGYEVNKLSSSKGFRVLEVRK